MSRFVVDHRSLLALRATLGRPPWLRGVGIGLDHHGSNLLVQVSALTPEARAAVPADLYKNVRLFQLLAP